MGRVTSVTEAGLPLGEPPRCPCPGTAGLPQGERPGDLSRSSRAVSRSGRPCPGTGSPTAAPEQSGGRILQEETFGSSEKGAFPFGALSGTLLEMGNGFSDQTSILASLPSFQSFHIVILGLDCAGKTTVLYRLQFNEFVNTVPTKGFNTEKIKVTLGNSKTVTFHFWDVGGQEKLRPLWKSYTRCTDGIVFVVDSVDVERMEEAKTELHKITRISENQGVPVLIVANKQDLRNSLSLSEIEKLLAMGELSSSTPWYLQPTCAIIGDGLKEGLEKLHEMILKRRKMLRQQKKKR